MLVVLTETYCNKVNIQITERDDFNHKDQHFSVFPGALNFVSEHQPHKPVRIVIQNVPKAKIVTKSIGRLSLILCVS